MTPPFRSLPDADAIFEVALPDGAPRIYSVPMSQRRFGSFQPSGPDSRM